VENDTIVAPARLQGSAIAVVRMSGHGRLAIAAGRFRGSRSPERSDSHRICSARFSAPTIHPRHGFALGVRAAAFLYGEDSVEVPPTADR